MRSYLTLFLTLISSWSFAQNSVKQQAEEMGNALVRKDYKAFVAFAYPAIVQEMGGPQKMTTAIGQQMKAMESAAEILSISYGEPSSIIKEGKELQCTIPQQLTLKTPQGKVLTKSTLIAISQDEGLHWYFVDIGERDINAVRTSLPNVSRKFILPKAEAPQFIQ